MSGIQHLMLSAKTVDSNVTVNLDSVSATASVGSLTVQIPGPWSLSGATLSGSKKFTTPSVSDGLIFNPNGLAAYVGGFTQEAVYRFVLSTAWDVTTATWVSPAYGLQISGVPVTLNAITGLYIDPAGRRLYILNNAGSPLEMHVYYYTMSSAFNFSSLTYVSRFSVNDKDTGMRYVFVKPDGTTMYTIGASSDRVWQYELSTAWNVATASYTGKSLLCREVDQSINGGLVFKPDGTKLYVMGTSLDAIGEYDLATPWDVSTGTLNQIKTGLKADGYGMFIKADGTRLFTLEFDDDTIYAYDLT